MKVRFALSVGSGVPDPALLAEVVEGAEAAGIDTVWLSDVPSLPNTDPMLGIAYAAARTRKLKLGINLIPFGSTPYLVAHRLAQLDRLTGGRLLVTLVPGLDLPGEREALATRGRHRGRLMEELIPQLRTLWAGDEVAVGPGPAADANPAADAGPTAGDRSTTIRLPVTPVQDPLEVWLGGSGPEAVIRAGRFADGWLGSLVSPARAGQIRGAIQQEAEAAGRTIDSEHFGLSVGYARRPEDVARAGELRVRAIRPRRPEDGDPADMVPVRADGLRRLIGQLVDQGLSKFVLRPIVPVDGAGGWYDEIEWLAATVLDLQT